MGMRLLFENIPRGAQLDVTVCWGVVPIALLHNMRQFVRQQLPSRACVRHVSPGVEHDVATDGIGKGVDRPC
jgi:hypothetical protein